MNKPHHFTLNDNSTNTCLVPFYHWDIYHFKIEPITKHLSHCKINQSSWQTKQIDQREIQSYKNHAYNNLEKTQIIFIDKLIINPQFIGSQQTHRKKDYIEQISLKTEENLALRSKKREEAIQLITMDRRSVVNYSQLMVRQWC